MTLTPCRTCRLASTCEIKKAKIRSMRGLKLTSVKFRCDEQKKDMQPGMVVMAKLKYVEIADDEGHADFLTLNGKPGILRAVVMGWSKTGKVRIFVPLQAAGCIVKYKHLEKEFDDMSKIVTAPQCHVANVDHKILTPTGEVVKVCAHCGMPESASDDERGNWQCDYEVQ